MRVLLMTVLVASLLVACGPSGQPRQQAAPAQEIEVGLNEFRFEPATIEVSRGKVVFKLKNTGTVEHDFVLPDLGLGTPPIPPGQSRDLELEIRAQPGRYRIECDVPGHREAGMVGTLVVKP
ncbi:MAG: cupredoxin domain-containing protein [Armatimonadota bacterium]|nr:cupredoxin domain-containing protein [Armatimonadota bacterium]